jgi:Tfp pilus assembly protein PilO
VNKKKQSQSVQIALIVVGLLAVAALGYMFLIGPKRSAAKDVEAQIASTQAQIDANRAAAAVAATPPPEPVDVSELFRLSKAMPDRADMAEVILELNRIAKDTGITFESITPAAATVGEGYQTVPITLAFEGDFYGLSDYLFRLRNLVAVRDGQVVANGRLFNVQSISFGEGEDSFPQVKATLTVNAFVFGEGDPAATQAAPVAPPTEEAPAAPPTEEAPADPSATPPTASATPAPGATS